MSGQLWRVWELDGGRVEVERLPSLALVILDGFAAAVERMRRLAARGEITALGLPALLRAACGMTEPADITLPASANPPHPEPNDGCSRNHTGNGIDSA